MNALCTIVMSAALLAALPATAAVAAPDDPSEQMVDALNEIRADHGLRPLRLAPKLVGTASRYARTVIRSDSFSHGSSFRNAGFRTSGEIMAYNRGSSTRPGPAIRVWLKSPGHRELILSKSFDYAGAGIARGRFGGAPTTIWIVHFGAR